MASKITVIINTKQLVETLIKGVQKQNFGEGFSSKTPYAFDDEDEYPIGIAKRYSNTAIYNLTYRKISKQQYVAIMVNLIAKSCKQQ